MPKLPMGYDDIKRHDGETYSGMPVGATHDWIYPDGRWRERKLDPDRWAIRFEATKERRDPAPEGSGAMIGSRYDWLVVGHQVVEKLDKDRYRTRLTGRKWKVAHKRPYWKQWSTGYDDQPSRQAIVARILETLLAELEAGEDPLEGTEI